jgi:hypothetical protein
VKTNGTPVSSSAICRSSASRTPDARSSANGRLRSISPATAETVRLHAATSRTNNITAQKPAPHPTERHLGQLAVEGLVPGAPDEVAVGPGEGVRQRDRGERTDPLLGGERPVRGHEQRAYRQVSGVRPGFGESPSG